MCFISQGGDPTATNIEQIEFLKQPGKLTGRAPRLIYVNIFYSRRLGSRNRLAAKKRLGALVLRLVPFTETRKVVSVHVPFYFNCSIMQPTN
jgi:hypothetical protein